MDVVEREILIAAPPGLVWPALAHADGLSAWFGADARVDLQPGGRGVFRWPDGAERPVVVEDVEPPRRLAFRWLPFQRTAGGDVVALPSTRVLITLDEVPGGTRVRVVEQPAFSLGAGAPRAGGRASAMIAS